MPSVGAARCPGCWGDGPAGTCHPWLRFGLSTAVTPAGATPMAGLMGGWCSLTGRGGGGTIGLWDPEAPGWGEGAAALELNHVKFKSWRPQCPSCAQARGCPPRTERPFQACGRGAWGPGWHLVGGTLLALEQLQPQSRSGPRNQGCQPQTGGDRLTLQTAGRWAWREEAGRARGCRYRAQAMGGCGLSRGRGLKMAKGSAGQ